MADKSFGIKELNLIGASGTPTITSPNNLNLNASNVAISTDVTIGRHLDVDGHAEFDNIRTSGITTLASSGGITTTGGDFYTAGDINFTGNLYQNGTLFTSGGGVGSTDNVVTNSLVVTGISTFQDSIYLGNNDRINLGGTQDLQIYNTGTNSYIADVGVGDLYLLGTAAINLQNSAGSETYAKFNVDGASELYYDNSKKFETTNDGVTVTGVCTATSFYGDGSNLTGIGVSVAAAGYINLNGSSPTWTGTSGYTVAHSGGGGGDEVYTLTFPTAYSARTDYIVHANYDGTDWVPSNGAQIAIERNTSNVVFVPRRWNEDPLNLGDIMVSIINL